MQAEIHPQYKMIQVTCSCGEVFETGSTYTANALHIEVCSKCHPFYTGKQKIVDVQGRLETYNKRFRSFSHAHSDADAKSEADKPVEAAAKKKKAN